MQRNLLFVLPLLLGSGEAANADLKLDVNYSTYEVRGSTSKTSMLASIKEAFAIPKASWRGRPATTSV